MIPQPIDKNKILFHLITKEKHLSKPTLENISECLTELRDHCVNNDIFKLQIPKICYELDKFDFDIIRAKMLNIRG